ncbi:hypothetical protein [Marinomonas algarum]|uniref:PsiF repeat-containing protein n=1 Tax=Marinomonas algarum TaxID=2883105 RepID=A0A9X1LB53_9GAMM|nr:hypothetical protein [Marinomonas algarum]MCB5160439.1 hypothetical protein [Marinomonas algarum]
MSLKNSVSALALSVACLVGSTSVFALEDFCSPRLDTYLKGLQKTVDSKYMPDSQKETAQKVMDKIKASRNETQDCVLMEKLKS